MWVGVNFEFGQKVVEDKSRVETILYILFENLWFCRVSLPWNPIGDKSFGILTVIVNRAICAFMCVPGVFYL